MLLALTVGKQFCVNLEADEIPVCTPGPRPGCPPLFFWACPSREPLPPRSPGQETAEGPALGTPLTSWLPDQEAPGPKCREVARIRCPGGQGGSFRCGSWPQLSESALFPFLTRKGRTPPAGRHAPSGGGEPSRTEPPRPQHEAGSAVPPGSLLGSPDTEGVGCPGCVHLQAGRPGHDHAHREALQQSAAPARSPQTWRKMSTLLLGGAGG